MKKLLYIFIKFWCYAAWFDNWCWFSHVGTITCIETHWRCNDKRTCIHISSTCDGNYDCPDKSDEICDGNHILSPPENFEGNSYLILLYITLSVENFQCSKKNSI